MRIGYARVSTDGQSLEAQHEALRTAGCERVFSEKISGAIGSRQELGAALALLAASDTLVVCKLDRLARTTRDLLNILHTIGERGATFKSLGDTWADTTTPHGKLMVAVLGGLAEFERSLILTRTAEGRARAKANGVRFGRPQKLTKHQHREIIARRLAGETLTSLAKSYAVSHSMIFRLTHDSRQLQL